MHKLAEMFKAADSIQRYGRDYADHLHEVLRGLDWDAVARAIDCIGDALDNNHALYIAANGGSAAVAAHIVNDLVAGGYVDHPSPFRVFSLTDNLATVTALGNDAGFDNIFECQLRVYLKPGDVVLAMSVSGNSENIIRAVNYAKSACVKTVGFCGFTGGRLAKACDIAVHASTSLDEYGPVEDTFSILGHLVCGYLTMKRGKFLHH
jgi:D-sedoheptulose 7-phosphate isomerase